VTKKRISTGVSSAGDIAKALVAKLGAANKITKEDIEVYWKELAGETAFKHSRPGALRKKVLVIKVDNPGWNQQLLMQKRKFLKGLKRRFGKDRILDIHFKAGEF
jgi:predicted nucleic acid-binding Zn ribbon protein